MTDLKKKQKKRWGKKFIDKRDWKTYNEELVKVGEYMLEEYAGIPTEVDIASEFPTDG